MSETYNSHFANLQASPEIHMVNILEPMKRLGNTSRSWKQTPKGALPLVDLETMSGRAIIVRYFVTRDDRALFAQRFVRVSPSTWNAFERGKRPISNPVMDRIEDDPRIPGVTRDFLKKGDRSRLGDAFLALLRQVDSQPASGPDTAKRRTRRSSSQ